MPRRLPLAGIAAALLLLSAGANAADWSSAPKLTVVMSDYQFNPAALSLRKGTAYRLHLENHGKEMHEFTAPEFFKAARLRSAKALNADKTEIEVPPGGTKDLYLIPQRPGQYPLRCSDHDWAGMTGSITVE